MGIEAVDARTLLTLCDLQSRRGIPRQVCHGMFATSEKFGVKVKRAYCRDNFLAQRPLPHMCRLSGDDLFMFQQDGTSARNTVAFLEREFTVC